MLTLHKPILEELWFREKMLGDEETMSYNHAWGGTISFPKEHWGDWYNYWLTNHENRHFYRYLQTEDGSFVGEAAYHYDAELNMYIADIIVFSEERGRGYGKEGLRLLSMAAKEHGIEVLYDNIAIDNPAIALFLQQGFFEDYRTEEFIFLKKIL